jgi:hypothetical protein
LQNFREIPEDDIVQKISGAAAADFFHFSIHFVTPLIGEEGGEPAASRPRYRSGGGPS